MANKLAELATRPPTIVINTRVDARHLATLANYWHAQGDTPRSMSELVRLCVEEFAKLLSSNDITTFIPDQASAIEVLTRLGLTVKKIPPRNFQAALEKEDINFDSLKVALNPAASLTRTKNPPRHTAGSPTHDQAIATFEEKMNEMALGDRIADANERTEEFKEHMGINPTNTGEEGGEHK